MERITSLLSGLRSDDDLVSVVSTGSTKYLVTPAAAVRSVVGVSAESFPAVTNPVAEFAGRVVIDAVPVSDNIVVDAVPAASRVVVDAAPVPDAASRVVIDAAPIASRVVVDAGRTQGIKGTTGTPVVTPPPKVSLPAEEPVAVNGVPCAPAAPRVRPPYAPTDSLVNAIQDAFLLVIGGGDGWMVSPVRPKTDGGDSGGDSGVAAGSLRLTLNFGGREEVLPLSADADGVWTVLTSAGKDGAYPTLAVLVATLQKMKETAHLYMPRGASKLPSVGRILWASPRFCGNDGQPVSPAMLSAELATRNTTAMHMASMNMTGLHCDRQPHSQRHVHFWRLSVPGNRVLLLGLHVPTSVYFVCLPSVREPDDGPTVWCSFSVEDLFEKVLAR